MIDLGTMEELNSRQKQAKLLRGLRKIHRTTGVFLFVFFAIVAITGGLLGWKKHSGGLLLARSHTGTSTNLAEWLPLDSLQRNAITFLKDSISPELSTAIDRMEVRQDKGMLKITFKDHYWGLQLDGVSGKLLHIERRNADIIEQLHDASMLDALLHTSDGQIKRMYTTLMSLALLVFVVTGFWLWYGPRKMRKLQP